jgi:hypothetical protein
MCTFLSVDAPHSITSSARASSVGVDALAREPNGGLLVYRDWHVTLRARAA